MNFTLPSPSHHIIWMMLEEKRPDSSILRVTQANHEEIFIIRPNGTMELTVLQFSPSRICIGSLSSTFESEALWDPKVTRINCIYYGACPEYGTMDRAILDANHERQVELLASHISILHRDKTMEEIREYFKKCYVTAGYRYERLQKHLKYSIYKTYGNNVSIKYTCSLFETELAQANGPLKISEIIHKVGERCIIPQQGRVEPVPTRKRSCCIV